MPAYFLTGTDTNVGKTYVGAALARALTAAGKRVGVYKPVASGCELIAGELQSEDALALWNAAGEPLTLREVCPQCFAAPLAPPLAARVEGKSVDAKLLRSGFDIWRSGFDVTLVEGAGGLLSPISATDLNADLARDLGLPLIVVAANRLGTINHTLLTLEAASSRGLEVRCVVLSDVSAKLDESAATNAAELRRLTTSRIVEVRYGGEVGVNSIVQ
jgi:dethiobiotin synthetase